MSAHCEFPASWRANPIQGQKMICWSGKLGGAVELTGIHGRDLWYIESDGFPGLEKHLRQCRHKCHRCDVLENTETGDIVGCRRPDQSLLHGTDVYWRVVVPPNLRCLDHGF